MPPQKDPEEELKDAAARGDIPRPERTRCEECGIDFPSNRILVLHAKREH
jgi:hypothetical protein